MLTYQGAAAVLGCSVSYVRKLVQRGWVPLVVFSHKCRRFRESDLRAFIRERTLRPMKDPGWTDRAGFGGWVRAVPASGRRPLPGGS